MVYSVADPGIATVDARGTLMGLSEGSTTLTATLLPSGRTAEVPVTVYEFYDDEPEAAVKPPEPETITVLVSGDEGSVSVTASVSDVTAAVTAPTEEQLEEIVGKGQETGSFAIDLSSLPETVTAVSIPIETVKAIQEALEEGGEGLTIKLPGGSVTFDAEALASIASEAKGEDLTLNVEPIDESMLSNAQREVLEGLNVLAVYDIYLSSNNQRITDFGDGRATVEVENRLGSEQKPGGILVWYLAEDGTKKKQPTSAAAEAVRFIVTHFSNYVVSYDETLPGACGLGEACPMSTFDDLDKTLWYHDGVHWALEQGIMNGVGGGHFEPNTPTSRGMIVTMLYRIEGEPAVSYEPDFTDVEAGLWYTEAVRWAAANGIVNSYGDGRFGPKDILTREQLAAILCRYARYKGVDTSAGEVKPLKDYSDAAEISEWAVRAFRWAVDAGIINGVREQVLSPKTEASRAQVATMLMRYDTIEQ